MLASERTPQHLLPGGGGYLICLQPRGTLRSRPCSPLKSGPVKGDVSCVVIERGIPAEMLWTHFDGG